MGNQTGEDGCGRRAVLMSTGVGILGSLAGCTGDSSLSDDEGSNGDDSDDRPPKPDPIYDEPLTVEEVMPRHREWVMSQDSFSVDIRQSAFGNAATGQINVVGDRRLFEISSESSSDSSIIYRSSDGHAYQRDNFDDSVSYQTPDCDNITLDGIAGGGLDPNAIEETVEHVAFTYRETSFEEDEWVHIYAADSIDVVDDEFLPFDDSEDGDVYFQLRIADSGYVAYFELEIESPEGTNKISIKYNDETGNVSEPSWVSEAEIAADGTHCE